MRTRALRRWGLSALAALGVALASSDAAAAEPSNTGKRFRFHGELDVLSFSHFNPDGNGTNANTLGFGFGKTTGVDSLLFVPSWSLGFGYVFLDGNAIVGGRFVFDLTSQTFEDDDEFGDTEDYRQTIVSGQLVPYFRYLFRPGTKIRPFLEGRFGFGGSATASESDSGANSSNSSTIYPIVGAGGGAHFFIVDAFSVDAGLTFDYAAPHVKSRVESGDVVVETDYEKTGDFINIAAQAGFSVWF